MRPREQTVPDPPPPHTHTPWVCGCWVQAAVGQPWEDQQLTDRLLRLLPGGPDLEEAVVSGSGGGDGDGSGAEGGSGERQQRRRGAGYLTLEAALARPPPPPMAEEAARLPLTW